jgi:hypothetical protein
VVPKAGWVRFRWSRPVPPDAKSYRVRMDRAGRWHIAFAASGATAINRCATSRSAAKLSSPFSR